MCDKSFARKTLLTIHINAVHHKQKLFSCTLCDKSFAWKGALTSHVDGIHKKLKPFSCTLCDKSFARKGLLTTHVDTVHHKIQPFLKPQSKLDFDEIMKVESTSWDDHTEIEVKCPCVVNNSGERITQSTVEQESAKVQELKPVEELKLELESQPECDPPPGVLNMDPEPLSECDPPPGMLDMLSKVKFPFQQDGSFLTHP